MNIKRISYHQVGQWQCWDDKGQVFAYISITKEGNFKITVYEYPLSGLIKDTFSSLDECSKFIEMLPSNKDLVDLITKLLSKALNTMSAEDLTSTIDSSNVDSLKKILLLS